MVLPATPSGEATRGIQPGRLKSAMQWHLWNPWAAYYELHSTHPLIAHRLQRLSEQSASMQQEPFIVFDRRQPESYLDEFAVDLLFLSLLFLPLSLPSLSCSSTPALDSTPALASAPGEQASEDLDAASAGKLSARVAPYSADPARRDLGALA